MKKTKDTTNYFFVDESGDPNFYDKYGNYIVDKEGVSKILILGFIMTENPKSIRKALLQLRDEISKDKYFQGIPSLQKSLIAFHAKDDCPEVREKVYRTIVNLNFTAEIFVARKIQNIFNKRHQRSENKFYDDLISKLFENKLHLARHNEIFFAVRGTKTRQLPLELAISRATESFEKKWNRKVESVFQIHPHRPSGEPCLQVIDYINWAVQRAFVKGEMRFYKFAEDKVSYLADIYDTEKYPKNFYSKKNRFNITKISKLVS